MRKKGGEGKGEGYPFNAADSSVWAESYLTMKGPPNEVEQATAAAETRAGSSRQRQAAKSNNKTIPIIYT